MGNPTEYRGKSVTWQYGKRVVDFGGTSFTYDGLGRRTGKNGIRFIYDNEGRLIKQSDGLEFVYDNAGVVGVKYNDTQYFYRKDAQGNIIALLDNTGNVVVVYVYDSWGNHAVKAEEEFLPLANANPYRYRGYYYDPETGLYYLQTRYYDPEIGRFISQDSIEYANPETINGLNLYAYCNNNPVMNVDPTGHFLVELFSILATLLIGAAIGGVVGGVAAIATGGDFWTGFAVGAVSGLISTVGTMLAVATGGIGGLLIAGGFGFVAGFSSNIVQQGIEKGWNNINYGSAILSGVIGGIIGIFTYGLTNFAMRESVGLFDDLFDKTLSFGVRFLNSLKVSPQAIMATILFSFPITIVQGLLEIASKLFGR